MSARAIVRLLTQVYEIVPPNHLSSHETASKEAAMSCCGQGRARLRARSASFWSPLDDLTPAAPPPTDEPADDDVPALDEQHEPDPPAES